MKIIAFNIRGFGFGTKDDKSGNLRSLINKEKPSIIALQETKLKTMDFNWVRSVWGSDDCDFIQREMVGKSGGQLLIWDTNQFLAGSVIGGDYTIGIKGKWAVSGLNCGIVNVYDPHDDPGKQKLWAYVSTLVDSYLDEALVLCGDFNEVRSEDERFNCEFLEYRAKKFNNLITDSSLIDIPMLGRIFTRLDDVEVEDVIRSAWAIGVPVIDRKDCTFRNRLKNVKVKIKEWSNNKFNNLEGEIETHKSIAQALELKAEHTVLDDVELENW
ncbi:uncharacterized protein [Rutidosis leptorrhynchoides]|uniref:uncharacterized protein n=1 Tax=Rutidosis leptorrhynchoides TaxID=125765 RepID=UPI003A99F63E